MNERDQLKARESEIRAFMKTHAGKFQTNDARALLAIYLRDLETRIYGEPTTPMPGNPNP